MFSRPRGPLFQPANPAFPNSPDTADGELIVSSGDSIEDPNTHEIFTARAHLGKGEFGRVYRVSLQNSRPPALFAMKISRTDPDSLDAFGIESEFLQTLFESNPPPGILRFHSFFEFKGHACLVTECLGKNLFSFLKERRFVGFPLYLIQSVMRDLLPALGCLAGNHIVHTDIKPENILTVSMVSQHVKLADFGAAIWEADTYSGYVQTRHYRSPEAILRLPLTCKSDIWSLGCGAAELTLGLPLLPGKSEVHQLFLIASMFGRFPQKVIDQSPLAGLYFKENGEVKSADELFEVDRKGVDWRTEKSYYRYSKLDEIIMSIGKASADAEADAKQRTAKELLLQMIRKMLVINPEERVSVEEAMAEPFMHLELD
jgi:serine/threonine protein kinase